MNEELTLPTCAICNHTHDQHGDSACSMPNCPCDVSADDLTLSNWLQHNRQLHDQHMKTHR